MNNFTEQYYGTEKIKKAFSSLKNSVAVYGGGANAVTDAGKSPLCYEIDYINKEVMIPVNVFSDFLEAEVLCENGKYTVKVNGKTLNIKANDNNAEDFSLSHIPYEKNSLLYVHGEEFAKLLGFSAFSDGRLLCIGTPEIIDTTPAISSSVTV